MSGRKKNIKRITTERNEIEKYLKEISRRPEVKSQDLFNTEVKLTSQDGWLPNPISTNNLGSFREVECRQYVVADIKLFQKIQEKTGEVPSFLVASPRARLKFDPGKIRAAIVTTGGIAPGMHCVVHSIVNRHVNTYKMQSAHGRVFGINNSFRGLTDIYQNMVELDVDQTERWLDHGGSNLGMVRYYQGKETESDEERIRKLAEKCVVSLKSNGINILYILGGDGSLRVAHAIAELAPEIAVVGIPKTMDNDILWVWQSFGFDTAVEQATRLTNILHHEAESTRRICLIELFGAESGFVAANATLASGHVDLVLVPEVFNSMDEKHVFKYLMDCIGHIERCVRNNRNPSHANIVVAEGVGTVLKNKNIQLFNLPEWMNAIKGLADESDAAMPEDFFKKMDYAVKKITEHKEGHSSPTMKDLEGMDFTKQFKLILEQIVKDGNGERMKLFINEPRHHIRAVAANPHDHIYCDRLGALAVDNALAGYTDFAISQWLSEYVLVPLELIVKGQKSINIKGTFWKQVICSTGQPLAKSEMIDAGFQQETQKEKNPRIGARTSDGTEGAPKTEKRKAPGKDKKKSLKK